MKYSRGGGWIEYGNVFLITSQDLDKAFRALKPKYRCMFSWITLWLFRPNEKIPSKTAKIKNIIIIDFNPLIGLNLSPWVFPCSHDLGKGSLFTYT